MKSYVKLFESWLNEEEKAINIQSLTIGQFKKKDENTQKNVLDAIFKQFKYDTVKVALVENPVRIDISSAGGQDIYATPNYDEVSDNDSIFELPFSIQLSSTNSRVETKVKLMLYFDWINNKMKKSIGPDLYNLSKSNSGSELSMLAFNDDSVNDKNAGYGPNADKYFTNNKSSLVTDKKSLASLANNEFKID